MPQALIDVNAGAAVHEEHVAGAAAAGEGAGGVNTEGVAAALVVCALVDILTGGPSVGLLVADVTDTLVGAHHVLTDTVGADPAGHAALVDVLAAGAVAGELVSRRALAQEGAGGVKTLPAAAQRPVHLALVDIHADLHHRGDLEALVTATGEAAFSIETGAVATDTPQNLTLVDVDTVETILVQGKALVAPAAVGAEGVLTAAVPADAGEDSALVDIPGVYIAVALAAQLVEALGARPGTLGAVLAPALSQGAAAQLPGVNSPHLCRALAAVRLHVAALSPQVKALPAAVVQGQTGRADAGEAAVSVDAAAAPADVGVEEALVDVPASLAVGPGAALGTVAVLRCAGLAGRAPALADTAAALGLEAQEGEAHLALSLADGGPAAAPLRVDTDPARAVEAGAGQAVAPVASLAVDALAPGAQLGARPGTLVDVVAGVVVGPEHGSGGTDALVAARGVPALSAPAAPSQRTLVYIDTLAAGGVPLIASVTEAAVAAGQVLTGPVAAHRGRHLGALVDVISLVGEAGAVGTKLGVLVTAGDRARRAGRAPAQDIIDAHPAAAAGGLGDHLGGGVAALARLVHGVAEPRHAVGAGATVCTQGEALDTLALEAAVSVGAGSSLAGAPLALVDIGTGAAAGLVARVAETLEAALGVNTAAVTTHGGLAALIDVLAEGAVG